MFLVIGMLLAGLWTNLAPQQRAEAAQNQPKKLEKFYYGEKLCRDCHFKEDPKQQVAGNEALLYRGIEMNAWDKHDKHKNATTVLHGKRAELMEQNLKYPDPVAKSVQCLSCHGVYIKDEDKKLIDSETFDEAQRVQSGVTCVACHGDHAEWVDEHLKKAKRTWRKYTR